MHHFCTYFDRHYLPRGLALYRSLARHARPFTLYVLCFDGFTFDTLSGMGLLDLCPLKLEGLEEGDEDLLRAKGNRTPMEYYFTCTPSLPLYLLDRFPEIDLITYLDADLFFYADPAPIYEEMGSSSVLIVGHRFPEDRRRLEKFGIYNVGLLGFRNDARARSCLHWWRERCLEWCYDRLEEGRFADQKYLDAWPSRFEGVAVLQHPGAGPAPWNLARYCVEEREGRVVVDGHPLICYHFHGLRILNTFLFDPGLCEYGATLGSIVRRGIYAPYLRELQALLRRTAKDRSATLRGRRNPGRGNWVDLLLHRQMVAVAGPFNAEVDLRRLAAPLSYPRALIRSRLQRKRKPR